MQETHYDETYYMDRTVKGDLFPFTEVKTTRPNAKPEKLADDLLNWLAWEFVDLEKWRWVFRGTKQEGYGLHSSLDKKLGDRPKSGIEDQCTAADAESYLLSRFKRAAHHRVEPSTIPDGTMEWLALMQHYGAPTRLLDFTRSPYVACYFAIEDAPKVATNDAPKRAANEVTSKPPRFAVWAVDTQWLITNTFCRMRDDTTFLDLSEDSLSNREFTARNFDALFVKNPRHIVLPVSPTRSNPRLVAQQGLFLCPSVINAGFKKNIASYKDYTQDMRQHVLKIIIESRVREGLLSEFGLMNISRATLYPDLEGYAKSLGHELEYKSSDEIKRSR